MIRSMLPIVEHRWECRGHDLSLSLLVYLYWEARGWGAPGSLPLYVIKDAEYLDRLPDPPSWAALQEILEWKVGTCL